MEEQVINEILEIKPTSSTEQEDEIELNRSKLIGLAQSGLLHKIGINKSESELKKMTTKAVEKVWAEYENRYNACVSDDLISNMLFGYSKFVKWLMPDRIDQEKLCAELKENFIVNAEMKKQLGRLGMLLHSPVLAVANVAVITAKGAGGEVPQGDGDSVEIS